MLGATKAIMSVVTSGLSELMEGSCQDGLVSFTFKKIASHFKSTDILPRYYNNAIKRSLYSLEIALKGPHAYYPKREKEFYQKHFLKFEQRVFLPFCEQIVGCGRVANELELRKSCIADCERIKEVGPRIFRIQELTPAELKEIMEGKSSDADFSTSMLQQLQQETQCEFLISLLEQENVLLQGIAFHFHSFLQSDPQFSQYVSYLNLSEMRKTISVLQAQAQQNPANEQIATRLHRLEQLVQMRSAYEQNMGLIAKKLDSIYKQTVQTYELLKQVEAQMRTGFNALEEKLNAICTLLAQQAQQQAQQAQQRQPTSPLPSTREPAVPSALPKALASSSSPAIVPVSQSDVPRTAAPSAGVASKTSAAAATTANLSPSAETLPHSSPSGAGQYALRPLAETTVPSSSSPFHQSAAEGPLGPSHNKRKRYGVLPRDGIFGLSTAKHDADDHSGATSPYGEQEQDARSRDNPLEHYLQMYSAFLQDVQEPSDAAATPDQASTTADQQTALATESVPLPTPPSGTAGPQSSAPPSSAVQVQKSPSGKAKRIRADQISAAFLNPSE